MKSAIIVPGVTDLNKGDQALVWESYRLVEDTNEFDHIYVLSNGDTIEEEKLLCNQTLARGIPLIQNILKHPRRGKHHENEAIKEGKGYFFFQVINALKDYISRSFLLRISGSNKLLAFFYNEKINHTINKFREADTIFVKGGGFVHAHGEKTAPYVIWFLLYYVNLAKHLGKKVVFLPNSYGPFKGIAVEHQVRNTFKKLDLSLARENISSKALGDLLHTKIPVTADLGFYLKASSKDLGKEILMKYNLNPETEKIIGITIRPWRFPGFANYEELYEKYINSVSSLILLLNSKGYKIAAFNQSMGPNAHEDDRNAIKNLIDKLKKSYSFNDITWVNENLTCDDLKAVYSNLYFFVGTRFHSVIFSMTSHVPSIVIAYGGNKATGIMKDFNLDDYVLHINDINPELLRNAFIKAEADYGLIKQKLILKSEKLDLERKNLIDLIKKNILD